MRWIIAALFILAARGASAQVSEPWSVASPDTHTAIAVERQPDGRLVWRVTRDAQPVLMDSPMGIRRADQAFDAGLTFVSASPVRNIDEHYTMPHGKRHDHHVVGRERTLTFANAAGAKLEVIIRAHDDGVAFRYRFPETAEGVKTVVEERTGFHVPPRALAWMLPHQEVSKYGPAYEDFFTEASAGTRAPRPDGWSFPALFRTVS
ncbi:MAG TPA: glycoside hydrolase family 97 N-terminal domain-containing protein, partial [Vicinamibacterales bacterium]|nr:glycoside hydrolase family 97 N-terminal domain-containing protein [Vicinamibacterales bacterium]